MNPSANRFYHYYYSIVKQLISDGTARRIVCFVLVLSALSSWCSVVEAAPAPPPSASPSISLGTEWMPPPLSSISLSSTMELCTNAITTCAMHFCRKWSDCGLCHYGLCTMPYPITKTIPYCPIPLLMHSCTYAYMHLCIYAEGN